MLNNRENLSYLCGDDDCYNYEDVNDSIFNSDSEEDPFDNLFKFNYEENLKKEEDLTSVFEEEKSSITKKVKKFNVNFNKTINHPWKNYIPIQHSIYINGKNGPVLNLYKNRKYIFNIQDDNRYTFILTDNPCGGPNSEILKYEQNNKIITIKTNKDLPKYFYYQCLEYSYLGGLIIIN